MTDLFKQIFTWWNRKTIGTSIYTLFFGELIGEDEFGNKYYTNKKEKRWVIYNDEVEASKIPPEWHMWIHFLTNQKPQNDSQKFAWQKKHIQNLTGTDKAHMPDGSLKSKSKKNIKKYETWRY